MEFPEKVTQLRALLASRGLSPSRRFGQNFLIEPRVLDQISRLAEIGPNDLILEVGTGIGSLTHRLVENARMVVTVEIDAGMHALSRDLLGNHTNLRLIHDDVMASKSQLSTEVCEKLDVAMVAPNCQFKVVANLPYNITTPFLSSLLVRYGAPDKMVLTVQKELAENLVARPSSKSYGPLSIVMQLLCDVEIERILNPAVFWPKPGVDSALVVASSRHRDPLEVMRVYPFIQYLFRERRKALGTILKKMPQEMGGPLTSEAVETVFAKMEFDSRRRAESLEPSDFLALLKSVASAFEGR